MKKFAVAVMLVVELAWRLLSNDMGAETDFTSVPGLNVPEFSFNSTHAYSIIHMLTADCRQTHTRRHTHIYVHTSINLL